MQTRKTSLNRKKTQKRYSTILPRIYNGLSGFGINTNGMNHKTTYGELCEESIPVLYEIFSTYAPLTNIAAPYKNFYDLGSGIGKVIIGMAYMNSSLKCTGIEVVAERVVHANTALQRLRDDSVKRRIELVCISMLDDSINYGNACWIFISNLPLEDNTNTLLFEKLAKECKLGTIVICSKAVSNPSFSFLNNITLPMSWSNESKVFVYKKI